MKGCRSEMRIAEWLTYVGIDQLKQLHRYYGCEQTDQHSKHELICSLLRQINKKSYIHNLLEGCSATELRFIELITLDPSPAYTMEELLAKGRAALSGEEGTPRSFVVEALKKGWLFPGYSHQTQYLYHMPSDTREQIQQAFVQSYIPFQQSYAPSCYRDEENQMVYDLQRFLRYLQQDIVRLTQDQAIYRQQFKQLLQTFAIPEEPIKSGGPRFGFGRMYHLYPNRFSLLYDYAYYEKYILEDQGYLGVTSAGLERCNQLEVQEGKQLYRFWIRLYRRPIPQLPIILRWIGLLSYPKWISVSAIYQAVSPWLKPFYYETEKSLFQKIMEMLVHLGVGKWGEENQEAYFTLTSNGIRWMHGISAFGEQTIEEGFIQSPK